MISGGRIKVMIVDDHAIVRVGLKRVLDLSDEFEVVGLAADGEEAVRVAAEVSPDVVVMDVIMPRKNGVEACREIMESAPGVRVVMLTASSAEDAVVEAVAAGAAGYLRKESNLEQLLSALRNVVLGDLRLPPEIVRRAFNAIRSGGGTAGAEAAGADCPGAGNARLLRPGHVLCSDSAGQGSQAGEHSERHLRHPAQTEDRYDAGAGGLVHEQRTAGQLGGRLRIESCAASRL